MKKLFVLHILVGICIFFVGCESSQKYTPVAVVNVSQVFQESEAAKAGLKYLEEIGDEMQHKFIELQQGLEADPESSEKQKQFEEAIAEAQGRLNAEQQQVLTRINDAFQHAVDTYRESHGIAVVIRSDQVISAGIVFDITNDILIEMNKHILEFTPIAPQKEAEGAEEAADLPASSEKH